MKPFRRNVNLLLTLVLVLILSMPIVSLQAEDDTGTSIKVLAVNDFHGALTEAKKDVGLAKIHGYFTEILSDHPNTIFVSAGDNYQGYLMSNSTYGEPVNEFFKLMGLETSVIGNHEYDWGGTQFEDWEAQGNFEFLGANIYDKSTNKMVDYADAYKIVKRGDKTIAFIGLATQETEFKTSPTAVSNLEFKDVSETARYWVDYLKAGNDENGVPDVIIALTHISAEQLEGENELMPTVVGPELDSLSLVEGIDAIITGHSHTRVAGYSNGIPVVQGYYKGRGFSVLDLSFDNLGNLLSVTPSIDLFYKNKDNIVASVEGTELFEKWNKNIEPITSRVLGTVAGDLDHDRYGPNVSKLGRWVTEVMQKEVGTDIAIFNGGTLRRGIPSGELTYGLLYEVLPFDVTLVTMDLLGSDLYYNINVCTSNPTVGNGSYTGLTVYYDDTLDYGSKVTYITLTDGTPIEMDKYYSVVVNNFISGGGDGFDFSQSLNLTDTNIPIREMLQEEIETVGLIKARDVDYVHNTTMSKAEIISSIGNSQTYTVKQGDVLWKISNDLGVQMDVLIDLNGILNADLILVGQELIYKSSMGDNSNIGTYLVKEGDYLWKIAKAHGISIFDLAEQNNINNTDLIFVGQELIVSISK